MNLSSKCCFVCWVYCKSCGFWVERSMVGIYNEWMLNILCRIFFNLAEIICIRRNYVKWSIARFRQVYDKKTKQMHRRPSDGVMTLTFRGVGPKAAEYHHTNHLGSLMFEIPVLQENPTPNLLCLVMYGILRKTQCLRRFTTNIWFIIDMCHCCIYIYIHSKSLYLLMAYICFFWKHLCLTLKSKCRHSKNCHTRCHVMRLRCANHETMSFGISLFKLSSVIQITCCTQIDR